MNPLNLSWRRSALLLAVLSGAVLRFSGLGAQSLWVDEAGTLLNVCWPATSIAHFALHANNSPPLYYWCVRPFVVLFGPGEAGVRFLSALSGVLAIPLLYSLSLRLTGNRRIAVWAAWLLAVSPLHLWFSQEARSYAFFLLLVLLSCRLFLRALDRRRTVDWLLLFFTSVAAVGTHLLAPAVLLIFWSWLALQKNSFRTAFIPLTAITLISGILWAGFTLYIRQVGQVVPPARSFSGAEIPYTFFAFIAGYSYGPSVRELQQSGTASALLANLPQTLTVLMILLGAGIAAVRYFSRDQLPAYSLILIPAGFAVMTALATQHAYNVRFVLPSFAGFLLLLAVLLEKMPRRSAVASGALLLGVFLWSDIQWFTVSRYGKEDSKAALQAVYRVRPDARKIMVAPAYMEDNLYYYLFRQKRTASVIPVQDTGAVRQNADADALLITRPQHIAGASALADQFVSENSARGVQRLEVPGFSILIASLPAPGMEDRVHPRKKYGYFPGDSSACPPSETR